MTRVLFVTSLYSTPSQPTRSPPNARIARAMKRYAEVKVVSPLPYYPRWLAKRRPDLAALCDVPAVERDTDGDEILHPRYLHIPKVARTLYPFLYGASIARVIAKEVASYRPDVILSAWAYPDGVASIALAKMLGVPSVLRVMGSDVNAYGLEPLRRFQIGWALRNATGVIAVSRALRQSCFDVIGEAAHGDVSVIPTGIDPAKFSPVDRDEARARLGLRRDGRMVLVPARLSREKGVHHFIEAFARIANDVDAVLVGDGPEAGSLKARVAELGIGNRVRFAGHESEARMPLYYSAADLACLPSTEEGWPNVLVEALACGCPWVASDVGGIAEIQAMDGGGLLARAGDPADLAQALSAGLAHGWRRDLIAERARRHTLDDTAKRYVESCEAAVVRGRRMSAGARTLPAPTYRPSRVA